MIFSTTRSTTSVAAAAPVGHGDLVGRALLLGHGQGLGHLAVVPVDGHGLHAELPGVDVELLDVLDGDVLGHVHRLGDGAGDERLHRAHHPDVTRVVDGVVAHGAGEHGDVLGLEARGAEDGLLDVDVVDDGGDLGVVVAEVAQGPGHRLVDDGHRPAADQLLHLGQAEVGLDAGGVAVHHQPDRPGGGEDRGLGVAHTVDGGRGAGAVPGLLGGREQVDGDQLLVDVGHLRPVLVEHPQHVLLVLGVAGEGPHAGGGDRRGGVGVAGHEAGDGAGAAPGRRRSRRAGPGP